MKTLLQLCITLSLLHIVVFGKRLTFKEKEYEMIKFFEHGISKSVITGTQNDIWVVNCSYETTYLTTGWDKLDIVSNYNRPREEQAYLAGWMEGENTHLAIYDHWYNTVRAACVNKSDICAHINTYLDKNTNWIHQMIEENKDVIYWEQVELFYIQMKGLLDGYNNNTAADQQLTLRDIMWMNFNWDFDELISAFKNESNKALKGNGHCSALIKVVQGQSDVLVAHNSWTGYETMRRIAKRYTLPLQLTAGSSMSFSGYPGTLVSGDDFYIISSGLVALETTNTNNNNKLYDFINPIGQVLEVVRVTVANRLAQGGRNWANIFSLYNSGTYNNQWMIVDMNKFSPGSIKPELLWVVEQMPGYVHKEDLTHVLLRQGYWASYNRPYYPEVFYMSGFPDLVKKYGDFFSHDKTARALIFKRDQEMVTDIESMMTLMRSNDFLHDPLSECACNPPYSADKAIAARSDLNPINGTYPFQALGHGLDGAIDAKVTSYNLSKTQQFLAVSGPSTGAHLPPFQWSKADNNLQLSHRGHPDLFNFSPVYITWHPYQPNDPSPSVILVP